MNQAKRGSHTERSILAASAYYQATTKEALAIKTEPATTWSRKANGPRYASKHDPDFFGHVYGRAFVLEAKEVTNIKRFPLTDKNIKRGQVRRLMDMDAAGMLSFLLINFVRKNNAGIVQSNEPYLVRVRQPKSLLGPEDASITPFVVFCLGMISAQKSLPVDWFRDADHDDNISVVHVGGSESRFSTRPVIDWADAMNRLAGPQQ